MHRITQIPVRTTRSAMVASANSIASLIGIELLRAGGNAIDAAIAMGLVMAVLEPSRSHIGGDVFLQYWDANERRTYALNGSGVAPTYATREAMGTSIPLRGIRAATVPGAPDGWLTALERWGSMSASDVFVHAISLATNGFALPDWQAEQLEAHQDLWEEFPESGAVLLPDTLRPGAILYQPVLARTLETLAREGRDAFYKGEIAQKIVAYSNEQDGFFTLEDLAQHRTQILNPIETTYRGVRVTEQPPMSQGHILLEMLNILEGFDFRGGDPESAEVIHCMAEAKKLAFADRMAYLGDLPDTPLETLLSKEYAQRQRRRINNHAVARYTPGRLSPVNTGTDTTSLCVIDAHGNAVTLIQSIFHSYGSGVVVPGTGILLNNRMTGFSLDPEHPNALAPGKRPMHTLNTYMMFKDEELWAVGGTPGADVQVQTNLQVITQMIDFGRNPQEAIESPKWHVAPDGPGLTVEERMPLDTCYQLRQRGHTLAVEGPWSGQCASQVIMRDPETHVLYGASDPRVEGLALGY